MGQTAKPLFPWDLAVLLPALAVVVLYSLPGLSPANRLPALQETWSTLLAVASGFLVGRWLHNNLWGLVIALLLLNLWPLYFQGAQGEVRPWLLAEAVKLMILAICLAGWDSVFQVRFQSSLFLTGLLLLLGTLVLWLLLPSAGLVASLLITGLFFLASCLAIGRRPTLGSSWANIFLSLALALAIPSLALVAAGELAMVPLAQSVEELLQEAIQPDFANQDYFAAADLEHWAWPLFWIILPLMVWGWWRSWRRGWKQWRLGHLPLPWVLSLYALADLAGVLLHPAGAQAMFFLPLVSLAVLLCIFCVADLIRGLGERLVLAPPEDNHAGRHLSK